MVLVRDGEKDCWAMLVSPEMVDHINFAKQQRRAIEKMESAVDEAATEVLTIEVSIEEAEERFNKAEGQETKQLQRDVDELQDKLRQAKDRRDMSQEDMESYQSGFECSKSTTQRMVEDALEEAGLLDTPEADSPSRSTAKGMDEMAQSDQSSLSSKDNESVVMTDAPTEEELFRRAACDDLDQSRRAQRDAQIAFDGRKEHYEQEVVRFDRLTMEGEMSCTRSEFDIEHDLKYAQQLTRNLREADEWLMRAEQHCQALGIRTDPETSYSDYSDYTNVYRNADDDSWTEQVTSPEARLRQEGVEAWIYEVWEKQNPEILEVYDSVSFDEWDSRPDDPMDSISVLDCDRWVVEIGRWQEHCTWLRDRQPMRPLLENRWDISTNAEYRRRSI